MAHIAYGKLGELDPEADAALRRVCGSLPGVHREGLGDDQVPYVFRALVHSPALLESLWTLLRSLWNDTELDRHVQELVILRVAVVSRSDYEWGRHETIARDLGVPDGKLDAVVRFPDAPELTDAERAAVALADVIAREGRGDAESVEAARRHFDDRRLVELVVLIGTYVSLAAFLTTLRIDQEPNDPTLPAEVAGSR